jgi:hypothetical protein
VAARHLSAGATRRILTLGDPGYPASLLEMADPPLMLQLLGAPALDLTQLENSIAMVGSRNATPQGASNARAFARAFAKPGSRWYRGLRSASTARPTKARSMRPMTRAARQRWRWPARDWTVSTLPGTASWRTALRTAA